MRSALSIVAVTTLRVAQAACGSQLDPDSVARANGGTAVGGAGTVAGDSGSGTTPDGSLPDSSAGGGGTTTSGGSQGTGESSATGTHVAPGLTRRLHVRPTTQRTVT